MYISIHSLCSILCWCTFGSNYSLKSFWIWCHKLAHPSLGSFAHSSLQHLSSSIRLDGKRRCTAIFRSLQRCSIGFKSGLWLGHSSTFTELSWSHSFDILPVSLGPLSCWKMNRHPSLRSRALWSRFSSRMSLYIAVFIFLYILTSLPVPATKKHPHSMMLPPPCFTVGMVLAWWWAVLGFLEFNHYLIRPDNCFSWSESPSGAFWQTPGGLPCAFY